MARTRNLPFAFVLILLYALTALPWSATAQQVDEDFSDFDGNGLEFEKIQEDSDFGGGEKHLEHYRFTFWGTDRAPEGTSIQEHAYPEALIVYVVSGWFVFRAGSEDLVVISPGRREIEIVDDGTYVLDALGDKCTTLCAAPPNKMIRIETGASVYIPERTTCLFCNISESDAELIVVASVQPGETFSWTQFTTTVKAGVIRALREAELPDNFLFGCR